VGTALRAFAYPTLAMSERAIVGAIANLGRACDEASSRYVAKRCADAGSNECCV